MIKITTYFPDGSITNEAEKPKEEEKPKAETIICPHCGEAFDPEEAKAKK